MAGFGLLAAAAILIGAAGRIDAHQSAPGIRPIDSVRGQRRRSDFFHRASAADARRRSGRLHAGVGGSRVSGPASKSARHAVHARRFGGSGARRHARDHLQLVASRGRASPRRRPQASSGSLAAVGIVYVLARARHRGLSTNVLLLAGVTMNAFFSALILFVQYFADFAADLSDPALADGRPRHQQLSADPDGAAARRRFRSRRLPGSRGRSTF